MTASQALVIVGAGHAGVELALAARQQGWSGPVELLSDEPDPPYQRPPLSKDWLCGSAGADAILLRPAAALEAASVRLRLQAPVAAIDAAARAVVLRSGELVPYRRLALCTGGRARALPDSTLPAPTLPANVHSLRTLAEARRIRDGLRDGAQLVVVGAGFIGLEVAASAATLGARVTVVETQPRVLARATGAPVAQFYERLHRSRGVVLRTSTGVQQLLCSSDGRVHGVLCTDGTTIGADLLVVGIGMAPNTDLASAAGLLVDGGVVVDAEGRTSDPDIFAAGDCTVVDDAVHGRTGIESVPHALEQARAAASALCGRPRSSRPAPWFWTEQFGCKLQMAGLSRGHDAVVVRGDPQGNRGFVAFYLRQGRVVAADAVQRSTEFQLLRQLVAREQIWPAKALADESISIRNLLTVPPSTHVQPHPQGG